MHAACFIVVSFALTWYWALLPSGTLRTISRCITASGLGAALWLMLHWGAK
jgi:hypothetical protein